MPRKEPDGEAPFFTRQAAPATVGGSSPPVRTYITFHSVDRYLVVTFEHNGQALCQFRHMLRWRPSDGPHSERLKLHRHLLAACDAGLALATTDLKACSKPGHLPLNRRPYAGYQVTLDTLQRLCHQGALPVDLHTSILTEIQALESFCQSESLLIRPSQPQAPPEDSNDSAEDSESRAVAWGSWTRGHSLSGLHRSANCKTDPLTVALAIARLRQKEKERRAQVHANLEDSFVQGWAAEYASNSTLRICPSSPLHPLQKLGGNPCPSHTDSMASTTALKPTLHSNSASVVGPNGPPPSDKVLELALVRSLQKVSDYRLIKEAQRQAEEVRAASTPSCTPPMSAGTRPSSTAPAPVQKTVSTPAHLLTAQRSLEALHVKLMEMRARAAFPEAAQSPCASLQPCLHTSPSFATVPSVSSTSPLSPSNGPSVSPSGPTPADGRSLSEDSASSSESSGASDGYGPPNRPSRTLSGSISSSSGRAISGSERYSAGECVRSPSPSTSSGYRLQYILILVSAGFRFGVFMPS
eukprot:gene10272-1855_t